MSSPDSPDIGALAAGGQSGVPQLPIENLIEQLAEHASDVVASQHRLRLFHDAYGQIVGELSLSTLLRRIVEVAGPVVGARYAALGVVGADGHFEQFLHSGLEPGVAAALGEPPKGLGVLGMMIESPQTTRVSPIAEDPHACGFPIGHPPMENFLAVPVRCRGELYAVLYLTEQVAGRSFDAADEEMAEALVAAASVAIDNAVLYESSQRRQEWLLAAANLNQYLLGSQEPPLALLSRTVSIVRGLLGADNALLLLTDEDGDNLTVVTAEGAGASALVGLRLPTRGSIAWRAMQLGRALYRDMEQVESAPETELRSLVGVGPMLALPLRGESRCEGVILTLRRSGGVPYTTPEQELAETFASQAAVAVQLVEARTDRQRLSGMEQRDQIARDLHEQVVRRLFSIGMGLQSCAQQVREGGYRRRLLQHADDLDETIRQIRSSIFTLTADAPAAPTQPAVVRRLVGELGPALGLRLQLELAGPLDLPAGTGLVRDVEAVLRESLTNASKYAQASLVQVRVESDGSQLRLTVSDNGVGLQGSTRRSGLDNLSRRAERYGGQLGIDNQPEGGLRLLWTIPL